MSDAQLKQSVDTYLNQTENKAPKPTITKTDKIDKNVVETAKILEKVTLDDVKSIIESKFPNNLKQFGYNIFDIAGLTFTPVQNIPVGSDYIIGPGDELSIYIWGNIQQNIVQVVESDGTIILPKSGKLSVANMSLSTAKRVINNLLAANFANFTMDLTVSKLKTIEVFVLGEAVLPGRYNLNSLSTLLYAIYYAGGPTKIGTLRNIQLIRDKRLYRSIDLYDLLLKGDKSGDMALKSGDTIFIPKIGNVAAIQGEVKVPAIYELEDNSSLFTIVSLAGMYTRNTYIKEINLITRSDNDKFVLKTIKFKSFDDFVNSSKKTMIDNGDIVEIKSISNEIDDWVKINGEVTFPGMYEYAKAKNMEDLSKLAGGFFKTAYLDRAEIVRIATNNSKVIIPIDLRTDLSKVILNKFDEVTIYNNSIVYKNENIKIQGEVNAPSSFPLLLGMTLKDLIFKSGGFKLDADKQYISILRNNSPSENKVVVVNFENESNFLLNPNDEIFVRKVPSFNSLGTIEIKGNVLFPGIYPLYEKDTVSTLFDRAGGITDKAYKKGIVLNRQVKDNVVLDSFKNQVGTNSSGDVVQSITMISNFDRIRINFDKIFSNTSSEEDIVLMNGDVIEIPNIPVDVKVVGGVYNQGTFLYKEHADLGKYLGMAGMFRKDADKDEIHIFHADGTVTKTNNFGYAIDKGDIIVVPIKQLRDFDVIKNILDWSQIAFNLAAVWKVIFN